MQYIITMQNVFRTVIIAQRNIELQEPYIVINENISPKLYEFLATMQNTKYEDGAYHTYYGELKVTVNNFMVYWTDIINECFRDMDTLCNGITKDKILALIDRTNIVHDNKREEFAKSFLPAECPEELKLFEDLENKYARFQEGMATLRHDVLEYERQDQLDQFIIKYSELGTRRKNEVFEYAHTIMALCLAENVSTILIIHYHYTLNHAFKVSREKIFNH